MILNEDNLSNIGNIIKNKKILVTGGTGSIGSRLVFELLKYDPEVIRIFSRDEYKQFQFRNQNKSNKLRFFIGDVRDKERLIHATEGVDIIFHAAALKHVPLCEYNPYEAVLTNVIGTQNVVNVALQNNVETMIMISTDKVVSPTNVMGSTKLLAERLVASGCLLKGINRRTKFAVVRFGNVLYSRGSVLSSWKEQLRISNKITLTDPEMTRFFMSIPQAVGLCIKSLVMIKRSEVFVLKMPALKMYDLALSFISLYGNADSNIEIIGKRVGEKQHEELLTSIEAENAYESDDMFIIPFIVPDLVETIHPQYFNFSKTKHKTYSSNNMNLLNIEQIKKLI